MNYLYLSAGHSYLWSSVDMDPAVGLPADGGAHGVGHPHDEASSSLKVNNKIFKGEVEFSIQ